jgi:nitrogen fixation/metabolism regulation signal transduction histidine kinase
MKNLFRNLEIEWKIFVLAAIVMIALVYPMQSIYISKLKATLNESIDQNLDSLLRSQIETSNEQSQKTIITSLQRNRQWQALIPIIIEEQSMAMILFAITLFVLLLLLSLLSLKYLTRPLRKLADAADKIGKGQTTPITTTEGGALGKLEFAMSGMQDELVKLRERARAQGMESAWRDIARVMAHEIKNPLTPIQLTLDRIQDRIDKNTPISSEDLTKFIERIGSQVVNLEHLVNDFRSFAREPEPIFSKVVLSKIIKSVSVDLRDSIATNIEGDTVLLTDPHLLQRALLNIWKNSLEAGATIIKVSIEDLQSITNLTIADNGCGIPPDKLEQIWIPYITFKKGGTGLGLPIVKRLFESLNASIELHSSTDSEKHGVTIKITFQKNSENSTVFSKEGTSS